MVFILKYGMITVQSMEFFGHHNINRKQKKSTTQITWTTERIWMDVIDNEQKLNSWNVKNNRCINTKS